MEKLTIEAITYEGEAQLGKKFNGSVIAAVSCDGKLHRILFDAWGNLVTDTNMKRKISEYFDLDFKIGMLDGKGCYIHSEDLEKSLLVVTGLPNNQIKQAI